MKISPAIKFLIVVFIMVATSLYAQEDTEKIPDGFVNVKTIIPKLKLDLRYYGSNNFVGEPIDGYEKPTCILTKEAAEALKKVQEEFERLGFGLLVYDAYRPQRAVNEFVKWAKDSTNTRMKEQFYPNVAKKDLFTKGYIASKSGHSRGSTIDVTIVSLRTGHILDLGGPYDFFDKRSWVSFKNITKNQRAIRLMLQRRMVKHGFKPYDKEWWHFTLAKEPYPDTYFDFPVK
ncbi:MAG TPA: peptidase M15 [Flavobacteriia bacterium]|jgi:D-alanyl-D-alanine dipeptidase|nr:peptidase M15 [Flavobacteriia bacterium]